MWIMWTENNQIIMFSCEALIFGGKFKGVVNDYVNSKSTCFFGIGTKKHVDNVDNLFTKQVFPDFNDVSGSHSYQQVAVNTIFQ